MSKLGMGAMLHQLKGGSPKDASEYYGKIIKRATFGDDEVRLEFEDGKKIKVWDDGQSCCESRYMTTDDDIKFLVGKALTDIVVKYVESSEPNEYTEHEMAFLEFQTKDGQVVFCTHNEHNGYYGGFGLSIDEIE
jgi:hypothetical protein